MFFSFFFTYYLSTLKPSATYHNTVNKKISMNKEKKDISIFYSFAFFLNSTQTYFPPPLSFLFFKLNTNLFSSSTFFTFLFYLRALGMVDDNTY